MKNLLKGKSGTILIAAGTLILAAVAIFTAVRLSQLRNRSVAPNAPESKPLAANVAQSCDVLAFNINSPFSACNETCSSDSDCETGLSCTAGACRNPDCTDDTDCTCDVSTQQYACGSACDSDAQCQTANADYICYSVTSTCRLADSPTNETCTVAGTSPTPTTVKTSSSPSLPNAGTTTPTMVGIGAGAAVLLFALLLAL